MCPLHTRYAKRNKLFGIHACTDLLRPGASNHDSSISQFAQMRDPKANWAVEAPPRDARPAPVTRVIARSESASRVRRLHPHRWTGEVRPGPPAASSGSFRGPERGLYGQRNLAKTAKREFARRVGCSTCPRRTLVGAFVNSGASAGSARPHSPRCWRFPPAISIRSSTMSGR